MEVIKKILNFLLLLIFLSVPISAEVPECERTQIAKDIPCLVISSWLPSDGCAKEVRIYQQNATQLNGTFVQSLNFSVYTPTCAFLFNLTEESTYVYNSSIEGGAITVFRGDNMLAIMLVQMFIVTFFIVIGVPHKAGFVKVFSWGLAVVELMMTVFMIYISEAGGSITELLYINAVAVLIIGGFIGLFTLYIVNIKLMKVEKSAFPEDEYTKWVNK